LGLKLDEEGWYSVTPENIAVHIATKTISLLGERRPLRIVDAFCGVGGNTIQYALQENVYCVGVDNDETKAEYTRHNAKLYGCVEGKDFEVKHSDFFKVTGLGKVDAIFMSPPWGGPGYHLMESYALEHIYPDFDKIIEKAMEFTKNLAIFIPRNTDIEDLLRRLSKYMPKVQIEVEKVMVGEVCKALVVYTGVLGGESLEVSEEEPVPQSAPSKPKATFCGVKRPRRNLYDLSAPDLLSLIRATTQNKRLHSGLL
jgi:trimethylguanosine synthase